MKKLIVFLFFVVLAAAASAQCVITVKGSVDKPQVGVPIRIVQADGFLKVDIDSIFLNDDNTFSKQVTLPAAGPYMIFGHGGEWLSFWGEDEDIEVHLSGARSNKPIYIHHAGPNNEVVNLHALFIAAVNRGMNDVRAQKKKAEESNSEAWKAYAPTARNAVQDFRMDMMDFLLQNYRDRNAIVQYIDSGSRDAYEKIMAYLEETKPNYAPFLKYKEETAFRETQREKLKPGNTAPDFSYPSADNRHLGPADYRGKYVLLDFWASWCGPCRASIPHLKEMYKKYHDRGFDILSISIDKKDADWRKAMAEEDMPWSQVLAPESGKDTQKLYQFIGIPHMLLLDDQGRIMVINARGALLEEALAKIFN
jgi:thiol-disulfide isomerase/thioredoxin